MFSANRKPRGTTPLFCAAAAIAAAALFFCARADAAKRDTRMLPGTVSNFELPNFNENSGAKEWELFGDKATYISDEHIDIDNMKLNLFEGAQKPELKAVMTSPNAQVNAVAKTVTSMDKIFVKGDAFDLSGKKWKWNGDKKFIEIFSNVKIALNSRGVPDIDSTIGSRAKADPQESSLSNGTQNNNPDSSATGKNAAEKKNADSSVTDIFSDYASLDHGGKANKFNVKKNVRVSNADMKLECDELEVDSKKSGAEKIGEIRARGNVRMSTNLRRAAAGELRLFPAEAKAVLTLSPEIEDIPSKSKIYGGKIILNRNDKSIVSLPSEDGKIRPKTILHNPQDEKMRQITVLADDIRMKNAEDGKSLFEFKGHVKVESDDFEARCDVMTAEADSKADGKAQISKIEGFGNVKVVTASGTAQSKKLEIIPAKSEILLHDNVKLTDSKRGFNLKSNTLIFASGRDEGVALADNGNKNSFVITEIAETPTVGQLDGKKSAAGRNKAATTVVKSRSLSFSRDSDGIADLHFLKDVSIKSADIDASCQKMDVIAKTEGSRTNIYKITASKDVVVKQKENTATAQLANIYPRVGDEDANASSGKDNQSGKPKIHRFVELLTDEQNSPEILPAIILPPLGNIGFSDEYSAGKVKPSPTVITSRKQWLTSSSDADKYYFKGDVKVTGTDMNASCDDIEVTIKPVANLAAKSAGSSGERAITHIAMTGNVRLAQGLKDAACGRADIHALEEMVVLSNSPVVRNREDNTRATGFRIIYNRGKQTATIEGEAPSAEQNAEDEDKDESARPTVVLPPIGSFDKK